MSLNIPTKEEFVKQAFHRIEQTIHADGSLLNGLTKTAILNELKSMIYAGHKYFDKDGNVCEEYVYKTDR